jgi:hypothetical protein
VRVHAVWDRNCNKSGKASDRAEEEEGYGLAKPYEWEEEKQLAAG